MTKVSFDNLLDAGVHFGHLKRKWNPNMAPYIFMERNGIHIIDLHKTVAKLEEAQKALKQIGPWPIPMQSQVLMIKRLISSNFF